MMRIQSSYEVIIGVVVTIIGLLTAILTLIKAYKENHNKDNKGDSDVQENTGTTLKDSKVEGDVNTNSHNNSHNVNIVLNEGYKTTKSKSSDVNENNLILQDTYTSLFAENGKIQSEKIVIENIGNGKIKGKVYLNRKNTYSLTGTFKNSVLTGEFTSTGHYTDERGTINLKLISENILSGFCSFSKISASMDDQIRMSPYVWVAGDNEELAQGTYAFCTECHNQNKVCCCKNFDIDMPVLLPNEVQKIKAQSPTRNKIDIFSHNIDSTPIRQINEIKNIINGDEFCSCYFYDVQNNNCKIYDNRPTDCRLFPFDIKLNVETHEYWVGYYSNLCDRNLPDEYKMREYAHILRPQIFLLYPYANIINRDDVCERLKNADFNPLYKLDELLF